MLTLFFHAKAQLVHYLWIKISLITINDLVMNSAISDPFWQIFTCRNGFRYGISSSSCLWYCADIVKSNGSCGFHELSENCEKR